MRPGIFLDTGGKARRLRAVRSSASTSTRRHRCLERESVAVKGLNNITAVVGGAEETIMCDACADIVFFGICLHDFQDPGKVLENAKRMLKPSGILADLDWKKIRMELGAAVRHKVQRGKSIHAHEGRGVPGQFRTGDRRRFLFDHCPPLTATYSFFQVAIVYLLEGIYNMR